MSDYQCYKFSDEQKKKLLELEGIQGDYGYCFDFERPDQAENVFLTCEEIGEKLKKPPKLMFWDGYELFRDLEDIFYEYYEHLCDQNFSCDEKETDEFLLIKLGVTSDE